MITAQGGITKWQRVRISSDGGMVAGKLVISKDASYPEKSSINNAEHAILRRALLDGLKTYLSETQRRRLWKHLVDGLSTYQIAAAEKVSHQSVLESIVSAKKKLLKKF